MLRKKKEAEKKAAAKAAAEAEAAAAPGTENKDESTEEKKPQKVSLLGVGGKKKKDSGSNKEGKKRTAGEIRIQKGESFVCICEHDFWFSMFVLYVVSVLVLNLPVIFFYTSHTNYYYLRYCRA